MVSWSRFELIHPGKSDALDVDVTSTLTTLITDGISSHSILLDSYVVLYAAFVSSLHKIIGVEFGTHNALCDPPPDCTIDVRPLH